MSVSSQTEFRQGILAALVSLPLAASLSAFVWFGSGMLF
jgi:hypothetical protein